MRVFASGIVGIDGQYTTAGEESQSTQGLHLYPNFTKLFKFSKVVGTM
jgi:hypothetical protein